MVTIVNGKFKLIRRLGGGAFGEVFLAVTADPSAEMESFAVKLEPVRTAHHPHLHHEAKLYIYMSRNTTTVGIPRIRWFGVEGDYTILVMELLGPSIEDIFEFCKHKFTIKSVLMIAEQMICRLQFVHGLSYLHRDIKPENFVMGLGKKSHHVYLLDFGLAKRYADWRTGKHIPFIDGKALTGTARYVSVNTHLGAQQSRRDDLEGVSYVMIYLATGSLPWQGIRCATKAEKYDKIKKMKIEIPVEQLCRGLPPCFEQILTYARSLEFEDQPDYDQCRQAIFDEIVELGDVCDYRFCWETLAHRGDSTSNTYSESEGFEGGRATGAMSSAVPNSANVSHYDDQAAGASPRGSQGGAMNTSLNTFPASHVSSPKPNGSGGGGRKPKTGADDPQRKYEVANPPHHVSDNRSSNNIDDDDENDDT